MTRSLPYGLVLVLLWCSQVSTAAQQKKSGTTKKKPASTAKQSVPDTITYQDVKDLGKLKDRMYEGNGWYRKYSYRSFSFVKHGSNLTGYAADNDGVWCFQGTFEGNVITISDAVNRDDEYDDHGRQTGRYSFSPLKDYQTPDFVSVRMDGELRTFPVRRVGWLTTSPDIVARDEKWMDGCLKHYSGQQVPNEAPEPPPCGDETLRPTIPSPGQNPTYINLFAKVCDTHDSANCTVPNVFAVMVATPRAIAPVKDPNASVENCGVLALDSFTNLPKPKDEQKPEDDNYIRIEIDEANHRIINSTMPGHVFWPGRVIRQIVLFDGRLGCERQGTAMKTSC
jgi:hypothetical protein